MALKIQLVDGINPFEWPDFTCPLCEGHEFTSIAHTGVYCDQCNARFVVRDTAGDPGCIVDCFTAKDERANVYAPLYQCEQCDTGLGPMHAQFDWEDHTCPNNLNHGSMKRRERLQGRWTPKKHQEYFFLILKLGDYCSRWIGSEHLDGKKRGPTQAQWDAWQERIKDRNLSSFG